MTVLYFAGLLCAYQPCLLHVTVTTMTPGGVRGWISQHIWSCTERRNCRDFDRKYGRHKQLFLYWVSWLQTPQAWTVALVINGRWRLQKPQVQAVVRDHQKMVSEAQTLPYLIVVLTNSVHLSNFPLFVSLKPSNWQRITILIVCRERGVLLRCYGLRAPSVCYPPLLVLPLLINNWLLSYLYKQDGMKYFQYASILSFRYLIIFPFSY